MINTTADFESPWAKQPFDEEWPLHAHDLPIHTAAYKGELSELVTLIASAENINTPDTWGRPALYLAILRDRAKAVRALLLAGADSTLEIKIQPRPMTFYAAFDFAVYNGSISVMLALLEFGIKATEQSLRLAASLNRVDFLRPILQALENDGFCRSKRLSSIREALECAALCWHVEVVEFLLTEVEGFPELSSRDDQIALGSSLSRALQYYECDDHCRSYEIMGRPERLFLILDQLVKAGVDVNTKHPKTGLTPFWALVHWYDFSREAVYLLLENGLRLSDLSDSRQAPLFGIVGNGNNDPSLVEAFIVAGAEVALADVDSKTPMHFVTRRSFAEVLFKHGADLCAKDKKGRTPFHMACKYGYIEVAEFLLSKGANIEDTATDANWAPLLFATCGGRIMGQYHIVHTPKFLLDNGANIQAAAMDGQTALHGAVRRESAELVQLLLGRGANSRAVQANGNTALHLACSTQNTSMQPHMLIVAELLLDHGADLEARNAHGSTPLHLSISCSQHIYGFTATVYNGLLRRGADRLAVDANGKSAEDLVDLDKWIVDSDGSLREKPVPRQPNFYGGRGRGGLGSRGHGSRTMTKSFVG